MRVIRTRTLGLCLVFTFFLFSCQKEVNFQDGDNPGPGTGPGTTPANNIIGEYDFIGVSAHTVSTVIISDGGDQLKTVTVSDYVSKDNTGTVKITSNQFITTGLGYSVDTMVNAKTYLNNVLLDDSYLPFVVSLPASSSNSAYVRNNADSITVSGAFGVASDPSGNPPTGLVGQKLSWSGDTLLLRVTTSVTQTITQGGIPANFTGTVNGITRLKKK
jgi:hypothetical protein